MFWIARILFNLKFFYGIMILNWMASVYCKLAIIEAPWCYLYSRPPCSCTSLCFAVLLSLSHSSHGGSLWLPGRCGTTRDPGKRWERRGYFACAPVKEETWYEGDDTQAPTSKKSVIVDALAIIMITNSKTLITLMYVYAFVLISIYESFARKIKCRFKGNRQPLFENFYTLFLLSHKRMKASTE